MRKLDFINCQASYLIFPRTLPIKDTQARVVGLNYQLIEEPKVTHPVKSAGLHKWIKAAPRVTKAEPQPPEVEIPKAARKKIFKITIERRAKVKTKLELEGASRKASERAALKIVKEQPFPLEKAELEEAIVRP